MKKLLVKKEDVMINGMLIIKKESLEQMVSNLMYINDLLGNDIYDTEIFACRILKNRTAIHVPITTTEKIWKQLKKSGNKIKPIATTEKKAVMPEEMRLALV